MKTAITGLTALSLLMLSGCVLKIGDTDSWDGDSKYHSARKQEVVNREYISTLPLGASSSQVVSQLGAPDFTEVFTGEAGEYRILRFRTHRTTSDGDTTRDETTPLVFLDGKLVGVGEQAAVRLQ